MPPSRGTPRRKNVPAESTSIICVENLVQNFESGKRHKYDIERVIHSFFATGALARSSAVAQIA